MNEVAAVPKSGRYSFVSQAACAHRFQRRLPSLPCLDVGSLLCGCCLLVGLQKRRQLSMPRKQAFIQLLEQGNVEIFATNVRVYSVKSAEDYVMQFDTFIEKGQRMGPSVGLPKQGVLFFGERKEFSSAVLLAEERSLA